MQKDIYNYITHVASDSAITWLDAKLNNIAEAFTKRDFYLAFSLVPRFFSQVNAQTQMPCIVNGVDISTWDSKQCVRLLLLLSIPQDDQAQYDAIIRELAETADIKEQISIYKALYLLPYPTNWLHQASEGLRSNATSVFEAVSLDNPYPEQYFPELLWNQMVLKAFFIKSPVLDIIGIEARRNADLAQMCVDYLHEQQQAQREVSAEVWCLLAPYLNASHMDLIQVGLHKPDMWYAFATLKAITHASINVDESLQIQIDVITNQASKHCPTLLEDSWQTYKTHYYSAIKESEAH